MIESQWYAVKRGNQVMMKGQVFIVDAPLTDGIVQLRTKSGQTVSSKPGQVTPERPVRIVTPDDPHYIVTAENEKAGNVARLVGPGAAEALVRVMLGGVELGRRATEDGAFVVGPAPDRATAFAHLLVFHDLPPDLDIDSNLEAAHAAAPVLQPHEHAEAAS